MHYEALKMTVLDEDGKEHKVFGIAAVNDNDIILQINDAFFCETEAEEFAKLCDRLQLDAIHLKDVIEDVVAGK